jgi:endonuclease/exonuclease/phosphatase family metal-dependent hydrolase
MSELHPHHITASLEPGVRAQLAKFHTRRALQSSSCYLEHRSVIEELCYATEFAPTPLPAPSRRFLRIVSWNLQRGIQLDGIIAFVQAHSVLRDFDLIVLNEVDLGMARSANRNVARDLAEALECGYFFGNSYVCLDHGDVRDPNNGLDNSLGLHGNAILSRHPQRAGENVSIPISRDKFESNTEKRLGHKKALWGRFETNLGEIVLAAAHLDPIATPELRGEQLEALLRRLDDVGSLVLAGDLNTTTYDLGSLPRLLLNVLAKAKRGGFAHAIHHYMHPWELYERPVFETLGRHGLAYRDFNDLYRGTVRYEVGSFDSESKVRDFLPQFAVDLLRWRLRPWAGVAPLRVDWACARGWRALQDDELVEESGRHSVCPGVVEAASWQGQRLSDHDPIYVDLVPAR